MKFKNIIVGVFSSIEECRMVIDSECYEGEEGEQNIRYYKKIEKYKGCIIYYDFGADYYFIQIQGGLKND